MRPLLIALALVLAGCTTETTRRDPPSPAPVQPPVPVPGRIPAEVAFSPVEGCQGMRAEEFYDVVNDAPRWRGLWAESCQPTVDGNGTERSEPPEVDFARHSVVAAFWGEKNHGGYGLRVVRIMAGAGNVTVDVERTTAGPGCATIQVITYPLDLVRTEVQLEGAQFRFEDRVVDC